MAPVAGANSDVHDTRIIVAVVADSAFFRIQASKPKAKPVTVKKPDSDSDDSAKVRRK